MWWSLIFSHYNIIFQLYNVKQTPIYQRITLLEFGIQIFRAAVFWTLLSEINVVNWRSVAKFSITWCSPYPDWQAPFEYNFVRVNFGEIIEKFNSIDNSRMTILDLTSKRLSCAYLFHKLKSSFFKYSLKNCHFITYISEHSQSA